MIHEMEEFIVNEIMHKHNCITHVNTCRICKIKQNHIKPNEIFLLLHLWINVKILEII